MEDQDNVNMMERERMAGSLEECAAGNPQWQAANITTDGATLHQ